MKKTVHKYNLKDPQQYKDDRAYWRSKSPEEKLDALEKIRKTGNKLFNKKDFPVNGNQQGLRRVLRVIEPS